MVSHLRSTVWSLRTWTSDPSHPVQFRELLPSRGQYGHLNRQPHDCVIVKMNCVHLRRRLAECHTRHSAYWLLLDCGRSFLCGCNFKASRPGDELFTVAAKRLSLSLLQRHGAEEEEEKEEWTPTIAPPSSSPPPSVIGSAAAAGTPSLLPLSSH